MNALGFPFEIQDRPKGFPNAPGHIHVWRAYPYATRRAPLLGFYALGRGAEQRLVAGQPFPEFVR